ncbi:cupredoxin domain-containing protein [Neobacillus pocheonensis]|uniref:Cupredoxin domain-containing protein n=1 Tax=Neobacillus pocheonensis TaxID=363869 RepID=A0ABT0WCJ8_9BACI|nr:cupredoxin domain-containing protein [Neobacillus pocheonensis]
MNKLIKKGTIAIALISALSFSLAGCGATDSAKTAKAKTVTASANVQKESGYNQYIVIEPGGKLGSDGKQHDAFINGDIKITEGQQVTLHFLNYDGGTHTYTSADLGLNVKIKGSTKKGQPEETTYTFTPKKNGDFTWMCADKCDGDNNQWAMAQQGYMQGKITVLPSTNKVQYVSMVINAGYKLGSDGKLHDAFTPGDIAVKAGQPVEVTIYNFDDGTHTLTSNDLGANIQISGSKQKGNPSVTTSTFTPSKKGTFKWMCADKCDGQNGQWAMMQDNYMMGTITTK